MKKLLIPLYGNDIAPRFDLATEVIIITEKQEHQYEQEKIVVMPQSSADQLCHLVLTENINTVICGGIEEEYYQYLTWKRVKVLDSVAGSWKKALDYFTKGMLESGSIVYDSEI
ncbi:Uncharacterized protein dnl_02540 [Desulfonema limicola]|uniref:Dinitrogenase iron-molybdenum cofactor biosynthesis protein n=1 Tax=Desulfonema limicola TaxID=45656 RepID=A0A975GEF2_9BACT|nr:hypothetical protein [Desulfonema limicola]QTA78045.1 Uncharacterized protein dnl_02540 [Desulfonema limicola]